VVVVGVKRLFALSVGAALSHHRNEDGYVQQVRWIAKSVTEINNRRVGVGRPYIHQDKFCKKTVQVLKVSFQVKGWGFL
jgi:hypothetical protein